MTNLLQDTAAWLGEQLQYAGGRSVIYGRGTHEIPITATPQGLGRNVNAESEIQLDKEWFTWTVTASDLLLLGSLIEPQEGDYIKETLNGQIVKWEVLPLEKDKPVFEWLDSSGLLLSVHTKRVV